jgi:hypothetical protein
MKVESSPLNMLAYMLVVNSIIYSALGIALVIYFARK